MKIGIVTIIDNFNYGNRLQNYAVQKILDKHKTITIDNDINYLYLLLRKLKRLKIYVDSKRERNRYKNFCSFNRYINFSKRLYSGKRQSKSLNNYDFVIVGSDQVWNFSFGRLNDLDLLKYVDPNKRIAFSSSFGVEDIPNDMKEEVGGELKKFKAISVREKRGKEIAEELTGRKDIELLVDPTMLITTAEWDKVSKKPKMLKSKKYILNYFLGNLSGERKKEIERVTKENDCDIINLLDRKSPFYECGPSEFLYLEKNAFLICTDSFHSCIFAILYNKPFIVFDREENLLSMNSRIETLLEKFKLKNRKFTGKITKDNLKCDYREVLSVLKEERIKAENFINKAMNIK